MRLAGLLAAAGILAGGPLAAQQGRVLDRIAAVVGGRAILLSQVEEQLVQLSAQGVKMPEDSAGRDRLRRDVLKQMIDDHLLVQQAERDTSIQVTDQEVQDAVEQTYQNVRRQFASEADFQGQLRQAGFASAEEWRRYLAEQQRRAIQRERLIASLRAQGKLRPIPPSDSAMQAFWDANRGELPKRPPTVSFRQIIVAPRADSASRLRAFVLADSLAREARRGADFVELARRFSSDSSTRESGGELGWFRRGVMVRNFELVAFRLRPGDIADPVETEFGFHVIKVERAQPAEVFARHILVTPVVSPERIGQARQLADSIHAALRAGASFDSLARRHHADPLEPKLAEQVPVANLPPEYQERLASQTTPGLVPVFAVGEGTPRPRFVVLEVLAQQAEGDMSFEDLKPRIKERLGQDLALEHYLKQLRAQTYVSVRL